MTTGTTMAPNTSPQPPGELATDASRESVLLLGYGAIGRYVAHALSDSAQVRIGAVLCRPGRETAARAALGAGPAIVTQIDRIDAGITLAIECAGHAALGEHGAALLASGRDLIGVSTGALADAALLQTLDDAARRGHSRCRMLSGAIGAIDALSAARTGGLESLTYRGRKPPAGWRGSAAEDSVNLHALTEATTFFKGTARAAALAYPKNANVAATVALAGIGLDATTVELVADPSIDVNRHEIEASGAFGRFRFEIDGRSLPDNPRSSALTSQSIIAAIEARRYGIRIG